MQKQDSPPGATAQGGFFHARASHQISLSGSPASCTEMPQRVLLVFLTRLLKNKAAQRNYRKCKQCNDGVEYPAEYNFCPKCGTPNPEISQLIIEQIRRMEVNIATIEQLARKY